MVTNNIQNIISDSPMRDVEEYAFLLLSRVQDVRIRYSLKTAVMEAVRNKNIREIKRIIKRIFSLTLEEWDSDEVIQEELERLADEEKEEGELQEEKTNIYEEPPTFDQAVLDYLNKICKDLESIPDLQEYKVNVERTIWEACFPEPSPGGGGGGKGGKRKVYEMDTLVKRDMLCVSADCQSGKTKYIVSAAMKGMLQRRTAILVVRRNIADADQLERSCIKIAHGLEEYLNRRRVSERRFEFKVVKGDNDRMVSKADYNIMNGIPQIIIVLGNETQLGRIKNIVDKIPCSFNLFIDEIDNVDYGETSQAAALLNELKVLSYQTTGVTATPLDCIFSEKDMKAKNQVRLTPPEDYRGFVDFTVDILTTSPRVYALNKIATYEEICKADANLPVFLRTYSTRPLDHPKKGVVYPNICLIKNTRFNDNQEALFEGINRHFTSFVSIVYNGKGIMMGGRTVPDNMNIGGKSVRKGVYFEGDISAVLQWLKDNGGSRVFPRIVIIAGELAGRCISYVSADYVWHLTDMYYVPAASTPIPEMIQSCGRLCGKNKGKSHLDLHTTKETADAIYSGFHFTNEVINRAIASPFYRGDMEESFAESVKAVKMNKKKMPIKRSMTTKVKVIKRDWALVSGNDGGMPLDKYKYKNPQEQDEGEEESKENNPSTTDGNTIPYEEFIRLIDTMFPRWANNDSRISRFMKQLDPDAIYTERIINGMRVSNLQSYKNRNNGYGMILQTVDGGYRLYPELKQKFNEYFSK